VQQPKALPPGSRGSMSRRAALQPHVDCRLAESKGFQKAGYKGAMWRFDNTCDLNLTKMLSMEWEHDIEAGTSPLHQRAFTEKMLKSFCFWQYNKPTKTPQTLVTRLIDADKLATPDLVLHHRYRAIVGAVGWLNQGTRPDISHAYSELSKFVQCPGQKLMDTAQCCLKYLAGTTDLCIHYGHTKDGKIEGRELNSLWGWVDTNFATDLDTCSSHTGYIIMMNDWPISWKSVKQKSVSLSTAESEWYAEHEERRYMDDNCSPENKVEDMMQYVSQLVCQICIHQTKLMQLHDWLMQVVQQLPASAVQAKRLMPSSRICAG
jgi:hypothetical protein